MASFLRPGWALAALLALGCKADASSAAPTLESVAATTARTAPKGPQVTLLGSVACASLDACVQVGSTLFARQFPALEPRLGAARGEFMLLESSGEMVAAFRLSGADGQTLREDVQQLERSIGLAISAKAEMATSSSALVLADDATIAHAALALPLSTTAKGAPALTAHFDPSRLSAEQRDELLAKARAYGDVDDEEVLTADGYRRLSRSEHWIGLLESNAMIDATMKAEGSAVVLSASTKPQRGSTLQRSFAATANHSSRTAPIVPPSGPLSFAARLDVPLEGEALTEFYGGLDELAQVLPLVLADTPLELRNPLIEHTMSVAEALQNSLERDGKLVFDIGANLEGEQEPTFSLAFTGTGATGFDALVAALDTAGRAYPQPWFEVLAAPKRDYAIAVFRVDATSRWPAFGQVFGTDTLTAIGSFDGVLLFTFGPQALEHMDRMYERTTSTTPLANAPSGKGHLDVAGLLKMNPRYTDVLGSTEMVFDLLIRHDASKMQLDLRSRVAGDEFVRGFWSGVFKSIRR